ncbi:MAG TPA: hypothetical protein VF909_12530 [Roseiflexaceae bacterium]
MPRVHINLNDIEELEELEELKNLTDLRGASGAADLRRETRDRAGGRGERRFGGAEALDRKRADRRKSSVRSARRI